MKSDKPDVLVGWLEESQYTQGIEYGGLSEGTPAGLSGSVAIALDYHNAASAETLAHEIGHNLDLDHTGTTGDTDPRCQFAKSSVSGYWPAEYNNSAAIREPGFDTVEMKVIPSSYYDIMSYCFSGRWITPFHYRKLFDQNVKPAQQYEGETGGVVVARRGSSLYVRLTTIPAGVSRLPCRAPSWRPMASISTLPVA
jgi:hypothetical protein